MRAFRTTTISILTVGLLVGSALGVAAQEEEVTWVSGDIEWAPGCTGPESQESDGDVLRSRNVVCSPQNWVSSDPRLSGQVARWFNEDRYQTDEGSISVYTETAYLQNDGGGWTCTASSLVRGTGASEEAVADATLDCIGDGSYQGLSAILVNEMGQGSETIAGLIFSGAFPPLPGPPAGE